MILLWCLYLNVQKLKDYFNQMRNFLLALFFSLVCIASTSSQERETEWEGECFIQYNGKVLVNDEICQMGSDDMPIDDKDNFLVVVTKDVKCDDGSNGCAFFFYAQQDKYMGEYSREVWFNQQKDMKKAVEPFRPAVIKDYIVSGNRLGTCFVKDNSKFCFKY